MPKAVQKGVVPPLRFPEFRDAGPWEVKRLGDVAQITMGASPKSTAYNEKGIGLPLLQGNADIKNRTSSARIFTTQITKECFVDDILLSVRAPVGSVAKSIHHACIGRGIAAIRAKKNNSQDFLYQWLLWYEPKWQHISQGGTFDSVNSNDIKQLSITIPIPNEQQKIADCLSSLDDLILAEEKALEALKKHKKGLMQQLFPAPGETTSKLRFPEFRDAGPWEVKRLGEILVFQTGFPFSSKFFNEKENGLRLIRNADLKSDDRAIYYSGQYDKEFIVQKGDILVGMDGDFSPSIWQKENALLNQRVGRVFAKDGNSQKFLFYVLSVILKIIEHSTAQTTVKHLSHSTLESTKWLIPKLQEQQKIADCLSSLDDLIQAKSKRIDVLKLHKKGLMQQLFASV